MLIASSNEDFRRQWIGNPEYGAVDVEEAAGGADALAKLESENWGEVLLDRRLHDLDVNEVLHIIRTRHPHLLVRLVDSDVNAIAAADVPEVANDSIPADFASLAESGCKRRLAMPRLPRRARTKYKSAIRVWSPCPE